MTATLAAISSVFRSCSARLPRGSGMSVVPSSVGMTGWIGGADGTGGSVGSLALRDGHLNQAAVLWRSVCGTFTGVSR